MQYVIVSTITSEERVINRSIVGKPSSSLEDQQAAVKRLTGHHCVINQDIPHRTWVDSRLRHKELTLRIHCIN